MTKKPRTAKVIAIIAVLAVIAGVGAALTAKYWFASRTAAAAPLPPPVSVVAAPVQSHDVPIYLPQPTQPRTVRDL
jgi:hypothetical protein